MSISTHILDTALGRPAVDVPVSLSGHIAGSWSVIHSTVTDSDGRCKHLLPLGERIAPGMYRVRFDTASYYKQQQLTGLYPYVDIVFSILDADQHYHIPLLLTANGYTTYRGS